MPFGMGVAVTKIMNSCWSHWTTVFVLILPLFKSGRERDSGGYAQRILYFPIRTRSGMRIGEGCEKSEGPTFLLWSLDG